MDYVLKSQIHTVIGETILADIRSQRSAYYFFVGGSNVAGTQYDSSAEDTYTYELATRNEIVSLKKLQPSDVSFVVPRVDWVSGTVYDRYDDYSPDNRSFSGAADLKTAKFYVLTDDYRVYKCLDNNMNAASTVKPISTLSSPFITADGYRWKYMYSIPLSSRTRFLNNAYMPVQTALSNRFYSAGKIKDTVILNKGSGYTTATINVEGDGTGAVLSPVISGGQIVQVIVEESGSGYTYANLNITGDGTDAEIIVDLSVGDLDTSQADVELLSTSGSIEAYRITNTGSGYSYANVTVGGCGAGATAHAVISNGAIVDIVCDTAGHDYHIADVTITGDGSGATAVPIISPQGGHGKNAINELFASNLTFYSNLLNDKNQGISITNDFRYIGILRNVKEFGTDRFYGQVNGSSCVLIDYIGPKPNNNDTLQVLNTEKEFRVVQAGDSSLLLMNLDNYDLSANAVLLNTTSSGQVVASTVTHPTIDKFSGDFLFMDNFSIHQEVGSQIIIFKTTLNF